jgi:type II secretory pathway component PulF
LVLFLSLVGAAALVFLVMPKLETVFGGFGGDSAEQIHRNIHTIEGILGGFLAALVLGLLGTVILKYAGKKYPAIREFLDRRILALPLAGQWVRSWESLNFSFAMEVLTGGGVPVEAALTEAAELVANRAYRNALFRVREAVINGGALSEAFAREESFPDDLSQWIAIGEGSGKPDLVFTQIRSYFQEEIEQRTSRFLLLIEPALIIAIGVVLLALIISIILPLFSVYGNLV